MADRPILFSAPMVRALLDGSKMQTRRFFKGIEKNDNGLWHIRNAGGGLISVAEADVGREAVDYLPIHVGDRLWVRETWSGHHMFSQTPPAQRVSFDTPDGSFHREDVWFWADGDPEFGDWERPRPGIHMPRWASRLTLSVTEARVERLQDISRGDAMEEGCPFANMAAGPNPRDWYFDLWNQINGPGAWEANPWVAAYTFTVIHKNIAEVRDVAA
jgi:hypothetical protein